MKKSWCVLWAKKYSNT